MLLVIVAENNTRRTNSAKTGIDRIQENRKCEIDEEWSETREYNKTEREGVKEQPKFIGEYDRLRIVQGTKQSLYVQTKLWPENETKSFGFWDKNS